MNAAAITIFLDFDGVIYSDGEFVVENLAALDHVCQALGVAEIVVTSSLRRGRTVLQLRDWLTRAGLRSAGLIAGVTPHRPFDFDARESEIREWCTDHKPARILILDDMSLLSFGPDRYFQVNADTGLTMADAKQLVKQYSIPLP